MLTPSLQIEPFESIGQIRFIGCYRYVEATAHDYRRKEGKEATPGVSYPVRPHNRLGRVVCAQREGQWKGQSRSCRRLCSIAKVEPS